jgi:hypothetical protein
MSVINFSGDAETTYVVSTGSSNAYDITLESSIKSFSEGFIVYMEANFANTGASTLNVNSLGAKSIKRPDGSDLSSSDIPASGIAHLVYDGTNFQLLGISSDSSSSDSIIQSGSFWYDVSTGTANAYAVTLDPVPALVSGLYVNMKSNAANTGAATIDVNSLGVKNIVRPNGDALSSGDIPNNSVSHLVYDGTNFQLMGVSGSTDSEIQSGSFWYDVSTGTANAYAVTLVPVPTLAAGLYVNMKSNAANTGASTIDVNSLGVKNIVRPNGDALSSGDIPNNSVSHLVYDGTNFQLMGVSGSTDSEIQSGSFWYDVSTGTANAYAVTLDPVPALVAGLYVNMKSNAANTGSATIDVNSLGVKSIKRPNGDALSSGDIPNNSVSHLVYDGTNFQLMGVSGSTDSEIQSGSFWYNLSTSIADDYAVTLDPVPTVTDGLFINMKANTTNAGASTISVNGSSAINIVRPDGSSLSANDILANRIVNMIYDGTNFQLLGSSSGSGTADETLINKNTSMNFRTLDVVQGQHAGAVIFEDGWVDSFSNSNEQGANQADSSGFQHDPTNKLYKAEAASTDVNSDRDYDEADENSKYIQQEWTNANQGLSQATFTNGTDTVTLNTGTDIWTSNCNNARIKNNSDGTFYDISSGQGTNTLTLDSNYTGSNDSSADWTILFSQFDSGKVKLNETGSGTGLDITSGQTYSADNANGSYPPSKAFNDLTGNNEAFLNNSSTTWIKIDFGVGTTKTAVTYTMICWNGDSNRAQNESPKTWTFEGSNNDSTWDVLDTQANVATWGILEKRTYNFSNSTGYRYYRWNVTANQGSIDRVQMTELEIMESANSNPINEYISVVDTFAQITDTSSWSEINEVNTEVTETLNSQNVYYWLSFDPASGYGSGTEIKIFDQTDSTWRIIAKNDGGTWKYNSAVSGSETLTDATEDDMLHAISKAIDSQTANYMSGEDLAAITDGEWKAANGFSNSVDTLARGLTLYSTSASQNPSVDQYRINHDTENLALDFKSKQFNLNSPPAKAFLWARVKHVDGIPGTFSVSRDGGSNWQTVTMNEKRKFASDDTRILRGVLSSFSGPSGMDLRARYQTNADETQELHSWGLQARD